jgi:membrane protein
MSKLKTAVVYWIEDNASELGAALAYYSVFSAAPLLIIALFAAGRIFGEEAARGQILEQIQDYIGAESASALQTMLANAWHAPTSPWAAVAGFVTLWLGALGIFTELRFSLTRIWRLEPTSQRAIVRIAKNYFLAFIMVLITSLFVIVLLSVTAALAVVLRRWGDQLPGGDWAWRLVDFAVSAFLVSLLFLFTFRFMSDHRIAYRQLWSGAIVGALLFTLGKLGIGFYVSYSQLASAYGVAGSLVVFLVWIYYSAQIFYFGAELVRVELNK